MGSMPPPLSEFSWQCPTRIRRKKTEGKKIWRNGGNRCDLFYKSSALLWPDFSYDKYNTISDRCQMPWTEQFKCFRVKMLRLAAVILSLGVLAEVSIDNVCCIVELWLTWYFLIPFIIDMDPLGNLRFVSKFHYFYFKNTINIYIF